MSDKTTVKTAVDYAREIVDAKVLQIEKRKLQEEREKQIKKEKTQELLNDIEEEIRGLEQLGIEILRFADGFELRKNQDTYCRIWINWYHDGDITPKWNISWKFINKIKKTYEKNPGSTLTFAEAFGKDIGKELASEIH